MTTLVPLLVALPLLGAAITLVFGRNARLQVFVTVATLAVVSVIAAVLLVVVDAGSPLAVSVGGWPSNWCSRTCPREPRTTCSGRPRWPATW